MTAETISGNPIEIVIAGKKGKGFYIGVNYTIDGNDIKKLPIIGYSVHRDTTTYYTFVPRSIPAFAVILRGSMDEITDVMNSITPDNITDYIVISGYGGDYSDYLEAIDANKEKIVNDVKEFAIALVEDRLKDMIPLKIRIKPSAPKFLYKIKKIEGKRGGAKVADGYFSDTIMSTKVKFVSWLPWHVYAEAIGLMENGELTKIVKYRKVGVYFSKPVVKSFVIEKENRMVYIMVAPRETPLVADDGRRAVEGYVNGVFAISFPQ